MFLGSGIIYSENMNNMNDFRKLLVKRLVIAFAVIAVLGIILAVLFLGINRRVESVVELKDRVLLHSRNLEALAVLRAESDQAAVHRARLETALPSRSKLFDFTKAVSDLGAKNKVEASINIVGEVAGTESAAGKISFSLTAKGALDDILVFINNINESGYVVAFAEFELIGSGGAAEARTSGTLFIR